MRMKFLTVLLIVVGTYIGCVAGKNLSAQQVVRISLSRHMVEAGNSLYVTCRVPTHDDNRWIETGIEGFSVSTRSMEGRHAPTLWPFLFKGIPCGTEIAYCRVYQTNGKEFLATQQFMVTGCDGQ